MEDFSRSYWLQHKMMLMVSGLVAFAGLAHFMHRPGNHDFVIFQMGMMALLCCPLQLNTVRRRLWWGIALILMASGFAALRLGSHNPISWIFALIACCAYAMGVCLRWHDPAIHSNGQNAR